MGSSVLPTVSGNSSCEKDATLYIHITVMLKAQEESQRTRNIHEKSLGHQAYLDLSPSGQLLEEFCLSKKRLPGQYRPYAKSTDQTSPPAAIRPPPRFGHCPSSSTRDRVTKTSLFPSTLEMPSGETEHVFFKVRHIQFSGEGHTC